MLDYETLRVIWWLLTGIVLIGFAVMDGFDLGAGALVRVLAHNDDERRALIETFEPVWEGNQVWLVLGGGAVFAAWPYLYAASFSGFYFAILLVLLALIVRPVSLNFRNKMDDARWRAVWDGLLSFSGVVPSLLFGVAMGNLFLGVPLRYDDTMRITYEGGLLDLLHPFALLVGLVSLAMILMHGATYLALKADAVIAQRAQRALGIFAPLYASLYVAAGIWLAYGVTGFRLDGHVITNGPSNPLLKQASIGGKLARQRSAGTLGLRGGRDCDRGRPGNAHARAARSPLERLRHEFNGNRVHSAFGGFRPVPIPDAVESRPTQQPDRVGRIVELQHARADARGHRRAAADRSRLYRVGVRGDARPRDAGAYPQVTRHVLNVAGTTKG